MTRPIEHDGVVFKRNGTKFWWIRYRDRDGRRRRESTFTNDWQEAQQKLQQRLRARDENVLDIVRKGESFTFGQWTDLFLENYSKPPVRAVKTHSANLWAAKYLKSAFATRRLTDITADNVELYVRERLHQPARFKTSGIMKEGG